MVLRCPVRRLGIVRRDRSCMLEQWATIHRVLNTTLENDMIVHAKFAVSSTY